MMNLVTLVYGSTNHYLIDCRGGKLLVDAGWAGSLPAMKGGLKRYGISPAEIRYVMLTHHHPDHAGLTQEVKRLTGARLIIHQCQIPFLADLKGFYQKQGGYEPIMVEKTDLVITDSGRMTLAALGVAGELVVTPGHSDDSVTLVLDEGSAFVGDLHLPHQAVDDTLTCESWRKIIALGARTIYHAHSGPYNIEMVQEHLARDPFATTPATL